MMNNISLMGWLHTIACLIALCAGAYVLSASKGTPRHRKLGWWYVGAMVALNLSVLTVYSHDFVPGRPPGPGNFGFFHWLTIVTLLTTVLAVVAGMRQRGSRFWAHTHAQAMLFSYYMLVGGLINELIVRVVPLRAWIVRTFPHPVNPAANPAVGMVQLAAMLLWLALVVRFAVKVTRMTRRWSRPATAPSRAGATF